MICKRCGNVNAGNSRYCRHCGAHLEAPGAAAPLPEEEFEVRSEDSEEESPDAEEVNRLLERAFALSERDDLTGAAFLCTQAIELDSRSISAHSLLGLLYERMGRREEAILEYERVVELNPNSTVDREHLDRLRGMSTPTRVAPPPRRARSLNLNLFGQSPYLSSVPIVAAATLGIVFILIANRAAESKAGAGLHRSLGRGSPAVQFVEAGKTQFRRGQYDLAEESFRAALMIDAGNSDAHEWLSKTAEARQPRMARASTARRPPQLVGPPPPPTEATESPSKAAGKVPTPPAPRPAPPVPVVPLQGVGTTRRSPGARSAVPLPSVGTSTQRSATQTPRPAQQPPVAEAPAREARRPQRVVVRPNPAPRPTEGTTAPTREPATAAAQTPPAAATPPGARELEQEAAKDYLRGDTAAAEDHYRQAVQASKPDDPHAAARHQQLAGMYFSRGDYDAARAEYQKAIGAYRQQRNKGVRPEAAERGIRTCESFIKLCGPRTTRGR